jgi:hypothetical protein
MLIKIKRKVISAEAKYPYRYIAITKALYTNMARMYNEVVIFLFPFNLYFSCNDREIKSNVVAAANPKTPIKIVNIQPSLIATYPRALIIHINESDDNCGLKCISISSQKNES